MSSSSSTVYLVTGANRGIGFGIVAHIAAAHATAFIYAGARDPNKASALRDLGEKYPGRIAIVKCVSGDVEGNALLAKDIKAKHGRVDTVIANAGIANLAHDVLKSPKQEFEENFAVNVLGPVVLFQALHDLLKASPSPRFIPITTGGASIGGPGMALPVRTGAYGASKAALNYVTRKIHFENEWLTAFPLAPGGVMTDAMTRNFELDETGTFEKLIEQISPLTTEQAAVLLLGVIDSSTREKDGGEFVNIDGTKLPW